MRTGRTHEPLSLVKAVAERGADALRPLLRTMPPALPLIPTKSDFDFNPEARPQGPRSLSPSAVLLPIVKRAEPTILFTRRTLHLSRHAGQVSFPGGRANEDDPTLVDTALRETYEETGIARSFVSVAGFLDAYETGTGYAILPVVGVLDEGFTVVPDENEVAEVFEVPLAYLIDPANRNRETADDWQGVKRHFYVFRYREHYIWGATAAILVNFGDTVGT